MHPPLPPSEAIDSLAQVKEFGFGVFVLVVVLLFMYCHERWIVKPRVDDAVERWQAAFEAGRSAAARARGSGLE